MTVFLCTFFIISLMNDLQVLAAVSQLSSIYNGLRTLSNSKPHSKAHPAKPSVQHKPVHNDPSASEKISRAATEELLFHRKMVITFIGK